MRKHLELQLNLVTFAAMNKKDKLIKRFKTQPRDFTFDEHHAQAPSEQYYKGLHDARHIELSINQ